MAAIAHDDELVEECVVDNGLVELLKSFQLSAVSIEEFVGMYTPLLPPPRLAERTKCIAGLNEWRRSLVSGCDYEFRKV